MRVVVLLPPDMEGSAIDLAVTTPNNAGQTAVFPIEDALNLKHFPLRRDDKADKTKKLILRNCIKIKARK